MIITGKLVLTNYIKDLKDLKILYFITLLGLTEPYLNPMYVCTGGFMLV